jgi:hypothetical protein
MTARSTSAELRRLVRAVRILARDGRIPRSLRWLVAFGLLPLPGPLDELALLVAGGVLFVFHRGRLRAAWRDAYGAERSTISVS